MSSRTVEIIPGCSRGLGCGFDPTYDPVFKRIFKKKKNLIHFLNAILRLKGKREIVSVTHLRPTLHLRTPKKGKKITRFDIHARTRDGRFIDIEMQRA
ncbi:MAG: PD-(D/E)XK nuclease family transposase [Fibrobacter sp.]|nr:PD-(D/E)XK nuclease family transposase [Fibrobacter sp.]